MGQVLDEAEGNKRQLGYYLAVVDVAQCRYDCYHEERDDESRLHLREA
eukprot:CAMPEP_0204906954 /NCGR_PEP_ID=MMETSP1397-20131031/6242_1 /ASSEMBLY_ACC=CAM_ASM_000891 /TAXON_ID=49980 /ORGANISM="Climacostomum Climacostomum virens, Strain Stock W-24" /LENGTH=47 /DNA_ID= /DNA_START= /DNA_END= /DNA_ORIENTATION=